MVEELFNTNSNFLHQTVTNYYDCIANLIYNLQKYINFFHNDIGKYYDNDVVDEDINGLVSFVISESENILKYKIVAFANDVSSLLKRKYDDLTARILIEGSGYTYTFSNEACLFLDKFQDEIVQMDLKNYSVKSVDSVQNEYNVSEHMENEFKKYKDMLFNDLKHKNDKDALLHLIDTAYEKIESTISNLRIRCALSTSSYQSIITCRAIITIMILLYHMINTIVIEK